MNILFLAYWGFYDGLTTATVMPHIRILEENRKIGKIIVCTIERDRVLNESRLSDKTFHLPWPSSHGLCSKIKDFTHLPNKIARIIRRERIGFIFCRGTPAGAIGYLVHRKTGVQYSVESFEPHGDYMRESGVWTRWDIRYLLQKYWERKQIETARFIIPVARRYYDHLMEKKVNSKKLLLMPCSVDLAMFAFDEEKRTAIRSTLGINEDVTLGIYVGKFGGMYYDDEAFKIFALAKKYITDFRLLVLSPAHPELIRLKLLKAGFLPEEFYIKNSPHSEVPGYLSASDFAFATYRPGYFKQFLSSIKVGEYWAAGLPVLLGDGIGDDSSIIKLWNIGSVFSFNEREWKDAFMKLKEVLVEGRVGLNMRVQPVAVRYRNFDQDKVVYNTIIDAIA